MQQIPLFIRQLSRCLRSKLGLSRRISSQKLIDFEKIVTETENPTATKSDLSLKSAELLPQKLPNFLKTSTDLFQATKLDHLRTIFKEDSLFSVSPVRSDTPASKNIFIDARTPEKFEGEDDQSQNEPKTPNFF